MTWRCALRGVDHPLFGAVTSRASSDRRAGLAIATGSDPSLLRWATKGDVRIPNEDACCVVDAGEWVLIAVADSHFGHTASQVLIDAIAQWPVPESPAELDARLEVLAGIECAQVGSATTLAIAVLDRRDRSVFGVSFADSTIVAVRPERVECWTTPTQAFVVPGDRRTWRDGQRFARELPHGAWLAAFTDGVDGCGGRVGASIGEAELRSLATAPDAASFAASLTRAALDGVGTAPGGHDNIAVAVVDAG